MPEEKALILDDDEFCRNLLVDVVQCKQIEATTYADPVRFLSTYSQSTSKIPSLFDYIITDNQMPGMTGLEFLETLNDKGCSFPVERTAIISGLWSDKDLEKAHQLGCRVFQKPCDVSKLHAWIEEVRNSA